MSTSGCTRLRACCWSRRGCTGCRSGRHGCQSFGPHCQWHTSTLDRPVSLLTCRLLSAVLAFMVVQIAINGLGHHPEWIEVINTHIRPASIVTREKAWQEASDE